MNIETIKAAAINGNNGYADFAYIDPLVKALLIADGFTIQPSSSIYYQGYRVYSAKATKAGK